MQIFARCIVDILIQTIKAHARYRRKTFPARIVVSFSNIQTKIEIFMCTPLDERVINTSAQDNFALIKTLELNLTIVYPIGVCQWSTSFKMYLCVKRFPNQFYICLTHSRFPRFYDPVSETKVTPFWPASKKNWKTPAKKLDKLDC